MALLGTHFQAALVAVMASVLAVAVIAVPALAGSASIHDKVIAGYQGWFNAAGDNSPVDGWRHWAGSEPSAGNQSFELYPDTREYPGAALFPTGYADLGGGKPAELFSSYAAGVVDTHFRWMQEYGIDGVALQRFGVELQGAALANRNDITLAVARAAEKYKRVFYVMYDISGMRGDDWTARIKADWADVVNRKLDLTTSPAYAREGGRSVVCIWGMGFSDRPDTAAQGLDMVKWLQSRGCYVIGGVPTNWRLGGSDARKGFTEVYKSLDMVSPWTVGRFSSSAAADDFAKDYLAPDLAYCKANGMAYQPVMFPGFAWSNWNGGSPNQIPRKRGELLWRQACNVRSLGLSGAYLAMFDEYDEGTAIAKAAEDSWMVPTDQYFLTLSADGSYVSSDFYLRLAGAATRVIKGIDAPVAPVPVAPSLGPVYFRTSLEPADAKPVSKYHASVLRSEGMGAADAGLQCAAVRGEKAVWGNWALKVSGSVPPASTDAPSAVVIQKAFEAPIPVKAATKLSFSVFATNAVSQHVTLDLMTADGHLLSDMGAADRTGLSLRPGIVRGAVGAWLEVRADIGKWAAGQTVDRIVVGLDSQGQSGEVCTYFDDIVVSDREQDLSRAK